MEGVDRKIIAALYENSIEFRRLYDEHLRLHEKLAKLENRNFLTDQEIRQEKELKLKKLKGREKLLQIIESNKQPAYESDAQYAAQLH